MNRATYLGKQCVQDFSAWLLNCIQGPEGNAIQAMNGVEDTYNWHGANLEQTNETLTGLSEALHHAETDAACVDACIAVFTWGGVLNYNGNWATVNQNGLLHRLLGAKAHLDNVIQADWHWNQSPEQRFNAGMTKVYSLLCENFIIYDSRVAAALAWCVAQWRNSLGNNAPPFENMAALAFRQPLRRLSNPMMQNPAIWNPNLHLNPIPEHNFFMGVINQPAHYATSNRYASWLVADVAARLPQGHVLRSLRNFEAALFMMGANLAAPPLQAPQA